MKKTLSKNSDYTSLITLCLCVAAVLFVIHSFTGQWFWKSQPYNSYVLQAKSWLEGRLDLGKNYDYLELAVFNGKYYVSFPPFPSYLMLPFVMLGWNTCDSFIAFAASITGAVYAFKILRHFNIEEKHAMLFSLFLTIGSNWLMTAQNAWVWFIAQNLSFTLCLMAIYYALKNKAALSLAFWACAVGCRPLQALYLPLLLYLIYCAHKETSPNDTVFAIIKKRYLSLIPMLVIAVSYMVLNFARFGSITEFGHNYLPEFTEAKYGQFNLRYIGENIKSVFALPKVSNGVVQYPAFNGMCMFLVSPIFVSYIIYVIRSFMNDEKHDIKITLLVILISVIETLAITAHKTMGGSHFGNRYTNDILPLVFMGLAAVLPKENSWKNFNYPLLFIGLTLNIIGTATYFMQ